MQIYINGKVQAAPVYCALLKTARDIAQQFADVGSGEFYAVFSKRVWQDSERLLFDRAFAGVRVGGFVFIGLFILLCRGGKRQPCEEQNRKVLFGSYARCCRHSRRLPDGLAARKAGTKRNPKELWSERQQIPAARRELFPRASVLEGRFNVIEVE